jgi:hypothetical protein
MWSAEGELRQGRPEQALPSPTRHWASSSRCSRPSASIWPGRTGAATDR